MGFEYRVAFIGTGNMGAATVRAICGTLRPGQIVIFDTATAVMERLAQELGCKTAESGTEAAAGAEYVFVCVKPQGTEPVLRGLAGAYKDGQTWCVIAAGIPLEKLRGWTGGRIPLVRAMPNTSIECGEGMIALCGDASVPEAALAGLEDILAASGMVTRIPEGLMDQFTVVAGCAPAYAYLFLEALADGGVRAGLPRGDAMHYAAQVLVGAGTMALRSGKHPGTLKDAICSPAGSTIAGVVALEQSGFRGAVIGAVEASYDRTVELGK